MNCGNRSNMGQVCDMKKGHTGRHSQVTEEVSVTWQWGRHQTCHILATRHDKLKTTTGYFGVPGQPDRHDRHHVHVVSMGVPVCGTKVPKGAQFQWCADGIYRSYVDCERCLKWIDRATGVKGKT